MAGVTVRDDVPVGATVREPSVGATIREEAPVGATVREGEQGPRPLGPLLRLPSALADRFVVEQQVLTRGNEADLLVAGDRRTGDRVVIKLYRLGIEPKADVMAMLPSLDARYVVRQLEHGHSDGHAYEVMEFVPEGDLATLLNAGLPAAALRDMIAQIAETIAYLHGLRPAVVHRDMKPDNILVRRRNPLELVLADFSFASVLAGGSRVGTTRHRTIRYAAPEAAAGDISAAADWWSLGMIAAEAALGRHPFGEATDEAVSIHLVNRRPVPLDGVADDRVKLLCQGLLCYEQKHRWGMAEVTRWLDGDLTLKPPVEVELPAAGARAGRPYRIGGTDCWNLAELAAALAANWDEAVKRVGRRTDIERWLLQDLQDQDAYNRFLDLNEGDAFRQMEPSARLSLWLPMLEPTLPPMVDGQALTEERFLDLARGAAAGRTRWPAVLQPGYGEQLAQLVGTGWLAQAYADWVAAAAEARSLDDRLIAAESSLQQLNTGNQVGLLLLAIDPKARAETLGQLRAASEGREARACPWAQQLLQADRLSAGGLWILEQRSQEIQTAGRLILEKRRAKRGGWILVLIVAGTVTVIGTSAWWSIRKDNLARDTKISEWSKGYNEYINVFGPPGHQDYDLTDYYPTYLMGAASRLSDNSIGCPASSFGDMLTRAQCSFENGVLDIQSNMMSVLPESGIDRRGVQNTYPASTVQQPYAMPVNNNPRYLWVLYIVNDPTSIQSHVAEQLISALTTVTPAEILNKNQPTIHGGRSDLGFRSCMVVYLNQHTPLDEIKKARKFSMHIALQKIFLRMQCFQK